MKTILLWDPRFPDRRPARLTVEDTVASAAVRAGVAAAANPAEAGALSADGALDPTMLTEVVLQHGTGSAIRRVFLPYSVVLVGATAGVLTAIGTPIAGVAVPTFAPVNTALPAITGTAQEGQILTASSGTWSNAPTAYAYQWKRGGVAITGSINATRTLAAADAGAVMTCTVTATNAGGSASADTPGTTAVIAASIPVPVNTVAPLVTGTAMQGQVLTADNGTWSNSPTSYAYAWRRGGVDIVGATASTYTLVQADVGASVTCRVLATNPGGTAGATSNALTVAGTPTIAFAVPSVSLAEGNAGASTVGNTINVTRNGVTGPLTINLTYAGTATSGTDYVAGPVSATIADGVNSASFDLTINGDTAVESDETIIISAALAAYPSSTASKTITVTNDDGAQALPGTTPATAAAMGLTPTVQYHPHSQSGAATKSNGKVIASPDLMGLAAFAQPTESVAPSERTDGVGTKCWRFDDAAWGYSSNGISAIDTRAFAVFLVVRCHNSNGTKFAAINYQSDGASGTAAAGSVSTATGSVAPYIGGSAITQADANFPHMVPGTRKQVIGMVSRTTANGGQRMYRNLVACPGTQQSTGYTNAMGLLFGATRASAGGALTGNLNGFDLYEAIIVKGTLTNAQADQIAAALVSNHAIEAITSTITDEGDSITEGVPDTRSGNNSAMYMTEPGTSFVPASTQVVNVGISGATTVSLTTRRDASPSTIGTMAISPANDVVIVQIGRNNYGALGQTAQQVYDALKALVWGDVTSYLVRGRKVIVCVNICSGNNVTNQQIRALIVANLITDCQAGPGGLYENKLKLRRLDLVAVGGQTIFEDAADASNLTYMQSDLTHPTELGNQMMTTGGDTPQHGKAAPF